jgi:hypothetical protein
MDFAMQVHSTYFQPQALQAFSTGKAGYASVPAMISPHRGDTVHFGKKGHVSKWKAISTTGSLLALVSAGAAVIASDRGMIPPIGSLITHAPGKTAPSERNDDPLLDAVLIKLNKKGGRTEVYTISKEGNLAPSDVKALPQALQDAITQELRRLEKANIKETAVSPNQCMVTTGAKERKRFKLPDKSLLRDVHGVPVDANKLYFLQGLQLYPAKDSFSQVKKALKEGKPLVKIDGQTAFPYSVVIGPPEILWDIIEGIGKTEFLAHANCPLSVYKGPASPPTETPSAAASPA